MNNTAILLIDNEFCDLLVFLVYHSAPEIYTSVLSLGGIDWLNLVYYCSSTEDLYPNSLSKHALN